MYTYTYISYRVLVEVRARAVSAGKRDVVRTNGRARTGPRKPVRGVGRIWVVRSLSLTHTHTPSLSHSLSQ